MNATTEGNRAGTLDKSPDFNKKILVVDDESAILQTLRFNLERSGYAVVTAGDGRSAIAMAQREQPDLIVLDIMLPVLDGVEACKEIRKFSSVPIIMLTAKDQEIDKVLALELGADDYVTKPFALHEFLARVKARLRRATPCSPATTKRSSLGDIVARSVAPAIDRPRQKTSRSRPRSSGCCACSWRTTAASSPARPCSTRFGDTTSKASSKR